MGAFLQKKNTGGDQIQIRIFFKKKLVPYFINTILKEGAPEESTAFSRVFVEVTCFPLQKRALTTKTGGAEIYNSLVKIFHPVTVTSLDPERVLLEESFGDDHVV